MNPVRTIPGLVTVLLTLGLLTLAGCSGGAGDDQGTPSSVAPSTGSGSGASPGSGTSPEGGTSPGSAASPGSSSSPDKDSSPTGQRGASAADIRYIQAMVPHHDQAVEMSNILVAKSDAQQDVVGLAQQIKDGQEPSITTLEEWLTTTGGDPEPPAQDPFDTSNGMLTPEQMQQLDEADGPTASETYLTWMIKHHEGAIALAESEIANGQDSAAVQHAQDVRTTQLAEVKTMQEMLENF